jgi:hypothetical protein
VTATKWKINPSRLRLVPLMETSRPRLNRRNKRDVGSGLLRKAAKRSSATIAK